MARAYVRLDPAFYERKLEQGYSLAQLGALAGVFCLADSQTQRGRFRDMGVLRALLGPGARHVPFLIDRGDLLLEERGRVYVDGWDEWQEGDWQVKERLARVRSRKTRNATVPTVASDTVLAGAGGERRAGHSKAENGAPLHAPRLMTDDERSAAIASNRQLLSSQQVEVQRAAVRSLRRLDPSTDWDAELAGLGALSKSTPSARPRSAAT